MHISVSCFMIVNTTSWLFLYRYYSNSPESCYMDSPVYMLWLFMYFYYMDYCYLNILILLLYEYFLNTVTDCSCITVIDMTPLLPDYVSNWYMMRGTKCHIELRLHRAKCHTIYICGGGNLFNPWEPSLESMGPPQESHISWISCFLLSCLVI